MSDYLKKLLSGVPVTGEEWNAHLREAHRLSPSQTPAAFAAWKTAEGFTTYEMLAGTLPSERDQTVLDLACGDGYLIPSLLEKAAVVIGVDMSETELARARERLTGMRVRLLCETAQAISVPAGSVDVVLCHMAFMLMHPIAPVVAEIRRVLKKGGRFAAVVGNRGGARGEYATLLKVLNDFYRREFPKMGTPLTGDARAVTPEGWRELFGRAPDVVDFELLVSLPTAQVFSFFKDMYLIGQLEEGARRKLKADLELHAHSSAKDGKYSFPFPMRLMKVSLS